MFLFPLILLILIVWFVVYIVKILSYNTKINDASSNINATSTYIKPIDILKERYVKGEISEEEYLKIKRNLE